MEKAIFPSKYIRITQGYNEGTHKDSFAIDNAGRDTGISSIYAPFTGVIKKIYQNDANEVWLESTEKVEYADGTIDYLTCLFAHDNDVSNLFVGKLIRQGEAFYHEGTKGNVTGNHCHIECGRGKFSGTGWHKNTAGYWSINNGKAPQECFFIDNTITVLDSKYKFKKNSTISVEKTNNQEIKQEESIKKEDKVSSKIKFTYKATQSDLYGIYLNKDETLIIEN